MRKPASFWSRDEFMSFLYVLPFCIMVSLKMLCLQISTVVHVY